MQIGFPRKRQRKTAPVLDSDALRHLLIYLDGLGTHATINLYTKFEF